MWRGFIHDLRVQKSETAVVGTVNVDGLIVRRDCSSADANATSDVRVRGVRGGTLLRTSLERVTSRHHL